MSKSFWGKDPFDDPFFTQPFGGMFSEQSPFNHPFFTSSFGGQDGPRREIAIEELNPDDDGTYKESAPGKDIIVKSKKQNETSHGSSSFSFRRVAYGGLDGIYYSSSIGRRTCGDGVVLLEINEEDKIAGQALHTISKGIHEKGHSVTTQRNPDGREDSMQILHNLNGDELAGFEETWKDNADRHLPGWAEGFNLLDSAGPSGAGWEGLPTWGGWPLPSLEYWGNVGTMEPDDDQRGTASSSERAKKIVPINIE